MSDERGLPPDLWNKTRLDKFDRGTPWIPNMGNALFLTQHFQVTRFTIGVAAPILVLTTVYAWPFIFVNEGTFVIYLGSNENVTVASGYPLFAGDKEPYVLEENMEVWAIAVGGNGNLAILEV